MHEYYDSTEKGHDQAYTVDDQSKLIVLGHSDCTTLNLISTSELVDEVCCRFSPPNQLHLTNSTQTKKGNSNLT